MVTHTIRIKLCKMYNNQQKFALLNSHELSWIEMQLVATDFNRGSKTFLYCCKNRNGILSQLVRIKFRILIYILRYRQGVFSTKRTQDLPCDSQGFVVQRLSHFVNTGRQEQCWPRQSSVDITVIQFNTIKRSPCIFNERNEVPMQRGSFLFLYPVAYAISPQVHRCTSEQSRNSRLSHGKTTVHQGSAQNSQINLCNEL